MRIPLKYGITKYCALQTKSFATQAQVKDIFWIKILICVYSFKYLKKITITFLSLKRLIICFLSDVCWC